MSNISTHHRFQDLTGQSYGQLTVKSFAGFLGKMKRPHWHCLCTCGKESIVASGNLKKSVGCRYCCRRLRPDYHGKRNTREWSAWNSMIRRCTNPTNKVYEYYGARGITVCERWLSSFPCFLEDMGPCPSGLTLDRIDCDGNYEPGNCRWATRQTQSRNRRTSHMITHNGLTMCLSEWSQRTGLSHTTILSRLRRGWSVAEALDTPLGVRTRYRQPS